MRKYSLDVRKSDETHHREEQSRVMEVGGEGVGLRCGLRGTEYPPGNSLRLHT
jgi:hypothetical protein